MFVDYNMRFSWGHQSLKGDTSITICPENAIWFFRAYRREDVREHSELGRERQLSHCAIQLVESDVDVGAIEHRYPHGDKQVENNAEYRDDQ